MSSAATHEEERRIAELFQALNPPLEDDGFSGAVTRRIGRRLWLRRVVLGAAVLAGGVLAFGPLSGLSVLLSEGLVTIATRWNDPVWLEQNRMILIAAVLAASIPGAIRLLER